MRRAEWTNTPYSMEGPRPLFGFPVYTGEVYVGTFADAEKRPYRSPFMVKFTERVINALMKEQDRLFYAKSAHNPSSPVFWDIYCRMHDLQEIRHFYEDRLAYYRGYSEDLPKRFKA